MYSNGAAAGQQSAPRDPRADKRGGVIVPGDIGSRYGGGHGTGVGRNEGRRDISPKRRINKL